jgi:L-seryl-tRNA(Ser) seleniumtransferase
VEKMLTELTGAEAAVVVNNCAAAAFLVLAALAKGGGVIVSRGELVEIGGDFRIPDVLAQSGCELREVGTTNRTKLRDYETAVDENTRLILRVHPSNYRVIGFTETPGLGELAALAHSKGLIVYEDAGSGAMFDLGKYGLCDEPVISRSIADGADIVTFSGDKLLGGPQAGLIVGRQELLERIRRNPLYRVLRPDKLTYAALGATLSSYARETAMEEIPVLRMLSISQDEMSERAQQFVEAYLTRSEGSGSIKVEVTKGDSVVGGGSAPGMHPETMLISLGSDVFSANQIEQLLRGNRPPVIARIIDDKVVLDLRTVMEKEENELLDAIVSIGNGTHP